MVKWIHTIHWGKIFLVGLLYTIFSVVVRQVELIWTMKYYVMPQYTGVWSKLMMPTAGPPPPEFMIVSTVSSFVVGMSLAIMYYYLREYLPKGFWRRSTYFADLLIATSFIFFTLPCYLLFNLPAALLGYWFVSTFVTLLVTSLFIVKVVS